MQKIIPISFVILLSITQNTFSQLVIPHLIPCLSIKPATIDTLSSGVAAFDCIEVDGESVNFKTDQHYSIRAGKYIQFDPNTFITSDGSHQFHAYIQPENLDVAWYHPNSTPGTVGRYEKLEIGVQFSDTIQQKVENFITDEAGIKLNPFNPDDIDLFAEFWVLKDLPGIGETWVEQNSVNGFYYQEYGRNLDTIHWDTLATQHNFRIRYAPSMLGLYRCKITANVYGHGTQTVSEFTFESVASDNKGFMKVGENKKYFEIGGETFFPVGQNLIGPNNELKNASNQQYQVLAYGYLDFERRLTKLKASGANYYRYIVSPWNTEIEFEKLGNYANRMSSAWEFDRILETTKALDLKMHFNLAMHYTFEAPNGYHLFNWDWSKAGDTLNTPITPYGVIGCFREYDKGYCYRNGLDMEHPRDFFTDSTAMSFYKKRIRYMEARWGYSTEIAVTEILSEANNAGSYIEAVTVDTMCQVLNATLARPYNYDSLNFPRELYNWHKEIANYMKNDLNSRHLVAASYGGEPRVAEGDSTFYLDDIDIASFNYYRLDVDDPTDLYDLINTKYHTGDPATAINKPFMNSEFGAGEQLIYDCDQNANFLRRNFLNGFSGGATVPITWDTQWDEQNNWHYYQHINDLMTGIQLDNEEWFAGEPIVQNDKSVEVLYLRQGELGENTKIVGAVANRTYNYYTQGDTLPCLDPEPLDESIYLLSQNFNHSELETIKFQNMGVFKGYQIEWINALTGVPIDTIIKISDVFGHLKLEFPGTLTGNATAPILFFKLFRTDATFKVPVIQDEFQTSLPEDFQIADSLEEIETTIWLDHQDNLTPVISVSPNPTNGLINCTVKGNYSNLKWVLTNAAGAYLYEERIINPNFSMDLSDYKSGNYYLLIQNSTGEIIQTIKLIKL